MNYKDVINLLTSQAKFQIHPGLERTLKVLELFDNPQNEIKVIHIAGTNGKGSVSSVLANILTSAGYKTGLYTSPHLIKYTERIKIDGLDISERNFADYISKVCRKADENNIYLTEFEILTVTAYLYFYENKVDFAIIETGLGGRFDATNTAQNKLLSVITSISFDHTDRLGDTIEKIAFEKAGIILKNSAVVISKENAGFDVIKNICAKNNSEIILAFENVKTYFKDDKNYILYNKNEYEFPLLGLYQNQNMALVFAAVEFLKRYGYVISEFAIKNGLESVIWHARLEYLKDKDILIDGAHNPDAALELKKSLEYYFPDKKRIFIYSTINTKDYKTIAKTLFMPDDEIHFYEFNHKNAVSYEEYIKNVDWLKNIQKLKDDDFSRVLSSDGLKIITGSLYMIGELLNSFNELR